MAQQGVHNFARLIVTATLNQAPDLAAAEPNVVWHMIGMGQSGKSPYYSYRFVDHARSLDAWFDAMNLSKAILVIHDWGSALGFHRASRYPDQIAAIAYMEAVVSPFTWEDFGEAGEMFRALRLSAGDTSFWTGTFSSKVYCQGGSFGPLARRRWPPIMLLSRSAKHGCRR